MNDLTSSQLKRLTELLMNCAPFSNEHQLRTLFIDPRIRPWQHLIPSQPENFHDLTRKTIALLMGKYNRQQESALVLFLDVLADNIDEGDHCHEQVIDLALELRSILTITPPPPHNLNHSQNPQVAATSYTALWRIASTTMKLEIYVFT